MGDDANSRYWSLKKSCSPLELLRSHIWNCYCTVRDVAVEIHSAEEDWTMQQQYTPSVGVRCNGVLWSLSCFYGITHAPFMYWIFSTQQWVSVSEWEWASGWDFWGRMKRRVYVISVKLYIFCMTNNGQVPTHTLKGKLEADTSVTSFLSPEQVWLYKTALFFPSSLTDTTDADGISQREVFVLNLTHKRLVSH